MFSRAALDKYCFNKYTETGQKQKESPRRYFVSHDNSTK